MSTMKHFLTGSMIAAATLSLVFSSACVTMAESTSSTADAAVTSSQETAADAAVTSSQEAAAEEPSALMGGWEINDEIVTEILTEESKEAFEKGIKGYTGMSFEPAALLATQLVAGTNYAYLCSSKMVVPNAKPTWCIVVVYEDLQGNAKITSVEELDLSDLKVIEDAEDKDESFVGAWEIMPPSNAISLPEDIWSAFCDASEQYTDVTLSPLALLDTQLVAGNNYRILCQGTTASENPTDGLYVVTMYVDLDGNSEFTDVEQLDFLEYIK